MRTKRALVIMILMLVFMVGFNGTIYGQPIYPGKPVQLVVAYGPGGAQDIFWRTVKEDLEKNLKGTISIVNKPGAGGALGSDFVANAKNDGYTLLGVATSTKTVIPAVDPKGVSDIHPIALAFRTPLALVAKNDSPMKSLKDAIAYAKEKPGGLTCSTQGIQAEAYFDLQLVAQAAGIKVTHVPNANPTDAIASVLGGHVDLYLGSLTAVLPLSKAGKLRILGITSDRKLPDKPDLPTFAELGFPQANLDLYAGLWGPKDLPQEVFTTWQRALKVVLGNPDLQATLRKSSMYIEVEVDREKIISLIKESFEKINQIAIKEGIRVK